MKNDAQLGGKKVSVKPTLLVSLMGITPDYRKTPSTDFKAAGDLLFAAGETRGELGGTFFEKVSGAGPLGACPEVKTDTALPLYRALHEVIQKGLVASCHDLSDGGLGVALAESALGGRLGGEIALEKLPVSSACGEEPKRLLFCETPSRFLISVKPEQKDGFLEAVKGLPVAEIGKVTAGPLVRITHRGDSFAAVALTAVEQAWKGPFAPHREEN